jgi:hypothetical protein
MVGADLKLSLDLLLMMSNRGAFLTSDISGAMRLFIPSSSSNYSTAQSIFLLQMASHNMAFLLDL